MNHVYFRHNLTRKYITIIGSLFDNYQIMKNGKYIKIPVSYGNKNKLIQRYLRRDVSFKGVQMTLPRIGFEFKEMSYDAERKLNRMNKFISHVSGAAVVYQYTPVPYNIKIEVSVITTKNNDSAQIVEQLIPKFTPDVKITSNLIPENNIDLDLSLCLNNLYINDTYQGALTDNRFITYNFEFTFKCFYFREIIENNLITDVVSYNQDTGEVLARVRPDPLNASPNSDYGYTET